MVLILSLNTTSNWQTNRICLMCSHIMDWLGIRFSAAVWMQLGIRLNPTVALRVQPKATLGNKLTTSSKFRKDLNISAANGHNTGSFYVYLMKLKTLNNKNMHQFFSFDFFFFFCLIAETEKQRDQRSHAELEPLWKVILTTMKHKHNLN